MNSEKKILAGEETIQMRPPQPMEGIETTIISSDDLGRMLESAKESREAVQETLQIPKEIVTMQVKIYTSPSLLQGVMEIDVSSDRGLFLLCQAVSHLEAKNEQKTILLRYVLSRSDIPPIPFRLAKTLLTIKGLDQVLFISKLNKEQIPKKEYMYELLAVMNDPRAVNLLFGCCKYKIIPGSGSGDQTRQKGTLSPEQASKLLKDTNRIQRYQHPGVIHQIRPSQGEKKLKELMQFITILSEVEDIKTLFAHYEVDIEYIP